MHRWSFLILFAPLAGCSSQAALPDATPAQAASQPGRSEISADASQGRTIWLKQRIAEQRAESDRAVAAYVPKTDGRLDDLSVPADELLRNLPGVADVTLHPAARTAKHRIVQLKDWHFVPKEMYAADLRDMSDKPLSDADLDRLYEEFLLEVELVQVEQQAVLRCLIDRHGLKSVFVEGLSERDVRVYRAKLAALGDLQKEFPPLEEQLAETRSLLEALSASDGREPERYGEASRLEADIIAFLEQNRHDLLQAGTTGRLFMAGELEILPLEEDVAYRNANPVGDDGQVELDAAKIETRQDAQVRMMLEHGSCAVVVLGGAHDLSDNAERLSSGVCEFATVTSRWYRDLVP